MKQKSILFSPWLLQSSVIVVRVRWDASKDADPTP